MEREAVAAFRCGENLAALGQALFPHWHSRRRRVGAAAVVDRQLDYSDEANSRRCYCFQRRAAVTTTCQIYRGCSRHHRYCRDHRPAFVSASPARGLGCGGGCCRGIGRPVGLWHPCNYKKGTILQSIGHTHMYGTYYTTGIEMTTERFSSKQTISEAETKFFSLTSLQSSKSQSRIRFCCRSAIVVTCNSKN